VTVGQHRRARGDAREAILAATLQVVAREGIDSVTHRRVAGEAGVSPGSTTHHFASREELLREAFRFYLREADRVLAVIDAAVQSIDDPIERVEQFLCGLLEQELAEASLLRAEYELILFACSNTELAADVRVWESRWVAHLADALEAGEVQRPIEVSRTLLNLVRGFELERLLNPTLTVDDFRRRVELLLRSLSANCRAPRSSSEANSGRKPSS
jgi:TetR/AcrR family transcriptional regulator, regulator of biofilm formation and stress response